MFGKVLLKAVSRRIVLLGNSSVKRYELYFNNRLLGTSILAETANICCFCKIVAPASSRVAIHADNRQAGIQNNDTIEIEFSIFQVSLTR